MTTRQRGTTAYSLPDSLRKSPRASIPFDPESTSALAHLMRNGGTKAAAVRDAVCEKARREGWTWEGEGVDGGATTSLRAWPSCA